MGFRCSFYHYTINYLNSIKDTPRNEDGYLFYDFDNEKEHHIMYDAFTDSICRVEKETEYCSPVFENSLDSDDCLYLKMNKEQFKNFIKFVLFNYIDYKNKFIIPIRDFDKLGEELKDGYKELLCRSVEKYEDLRIIDKLIHNQQDYNYHIQSHCADKTFFDEMIEDPWKVSMGWHTEMGIANLIHIYHMMDWENEELLIIGG